MIGCRAGASESLSAGTLQLDPAWRPAATVLLVAPMLCVVAAAAGRAASLSPSIRR